MKGSYNYKRTLKRRPTNGNTKRIRGSYNYDSEMHLIKRNGNTKRMRGYYDIATCTL